jgi:phage-related protein
VPAASKKEKVAVAPGGAETAGEPAATRSSEIAPGGAAEAAARTEKEAVAPSPPDAEKAPAKAGAEVPPAVEAAAPPPAEAAPAAEADPRFAAVKANLEKAALREAKHSLPGKRVKAAEVATRQPEEEPRATGMGSRVREMEQTAADAPKPPEPTFAQVLEEALERLTPKDPEGLDKLAKEGAGGAPLRKEVQAGVNSAKDAAAGPTETVTEKPPQEEGREPEAPALEPESAGAKAGSIGAESVLPEKKPDAEVSMEAQKQSADAEVARTGLTDEQLAKANEPSFNEALAAKQEVKANCDAAPERFRTKEAAYLEKSSAEVRDEEAAARTGMHASRTGKLSSGNRKADELKARREAERARVAAEIRKMFEATRDKVAGKLAGLDPKVNAMFDEGHAAAFEKMKSNIQERFEAWKDDRYSGLRGKWRWVKDRFRDINELSDVKRIYEEERQSYINAMKGVFRGIAAHVDSVMAECKNDIQAGRKEIETYVKGLGPELQSYGKEAAGAISSDFDALEQSIEDKKSELADSLANRYKESREQVDKWIEEEKDRNTALLVKLARKVKAIIETIRKLKDRLAAALAKARGAIGIIIGDPIGFLGNILSAVKQGFHQFKENIVEHLKAGIMGWLFGTIADAGITLPADFSLKSIFGLVLQVLGITPQSIRAKAVKLLGARNVVIIEKVWEFISKLISEGPAGLWEHIKEYLSDLKDTILDAVKEWVIAQIVKQAVLKLVSLFNPVGAFIQACLAIYNVVMFFVERIEQIIELVETVINSVYDIATGKIAAAANWIEKAMGRTVPIIISFLARLLGLGGVAEKIKSVITRIQTKVDQAVDKAINKIVGVVKKLFGKAGKTPPPTKTEGAEGEKLNVSSSFDMSGAPHTLSVEVRNGSAAIMMGSSAKTAKKLVDKIDDALGETSDAKVRKRLEGFKKGALKLESQLSGKPDAKKKAEIEKKLDRLSYQIHQFGADNDLKDLRPAGDIPEEGLAGSYNYLQGKKGDKMTPDHEPQNALMSEISDISIPGFSGFKKPFAGTAVEKYSMGEGICLNMHHSRHLETRTYGGRGSGTRNAALKKIDEKVGKLPSDAGKERVQKAIARVVVGEMEADQKQVKKIVNDSKWKLAPETKSRVTSGMDQVETMNKDKWPEAFKTG